MVRKKHPLMWFRQQKSLKKCLKSHTLYVVCALHRHLCHGNIAMARPAVRELTRLGYVQVPCMRGWAWINAILHTPYGSPTVSPCRWWRTCARLVSLWCGR